MRDGASTRRKTNKSTAFEYNAAALSILPMSSSTYKTYETTILSGWCQNYFNILYHSPNFIISKVTCYDLFSNNIFNILIVETIVLLT